MARRCSSSSACIVCCQAALQASSSCRWLQVANHVSAAMVWHRFHEDWDSHNRTSGELHHDVREREDTARWVVQQCVTFHRRRWL
jgi:hypothetical protein